MNQQQFADLLIPEAPAKTFAEHLSKTQVSQSVLDLLETLPDTDPFIMLNFVRFRPHRDASLYMRYAQAIGDAIELAGSHTPFYAPILHDLEPVYGFDNSWDEITAPVYSRLASYGLAQTNPDYQAALPDRVAGTFERLLYVLKDGAQLFPASTSIQQLHDDRADISRKAGNLIVGTFLRFKPDGGRETYARYAKAVTPEIQKVGGEIILSVDARIPVVSSKLWDHFTLIKYPSLDAYETMFRTDDFIAAGSLRRAALEDMISVPSSEG